MDTQTVTPELTGYQVTAAEFRRIADAMDAIDSPPERPPYLSLTLIPKLPVGATVEEAIAVTDALALAVVGKKAEATRSGTSWYHLARSSNSHFGYLCVQVSIPGPPDERDAELARLRAENERLRADQAGNDE